MPSWISSDAKSQGYERLHTNVSKNTLNGQTECLAQTYGTVLLNMSTKDQELTHMITLVTLLQ